MSTTIPLQQKAELVLRNMEESQGLSNRSADALYSAIAAAVGFVWLSKTREHFEAARKLFAKRKIDPRTNGNIYLPFATLLFWKGKPHDKPSALNKWAKAIRTCIDANKKEDEVVDFIKNFTYGKKTALAAIYEYDSAQYPNNAGAQGRTEKAVREIKAEISKETYGEIARPAETVTEIDSLCILVGEITGNSIIVRGVYTGEDDIAPVIKKFKSTEAAKSTASVFDGLAKAFHGEPAAPQEA